MLLWGFWLFYPVIVGYESILLWILEKAGAVILYSPEVPLSHPAGIRLLPLRCGFGVELVCS